MTYDTLDELPRPVRKVLPVHAQKIYQAAYNHAWEQYGHDEARAHRVAWSAVKDKYRKNEQTGRWSRKVKGSTSALRKIGQGRSSTARPT